MVLISSYKYIHYKIIFFKPDKNIYRKNKKRENKIQKYKNKEER